MPARNRPRREPSNLAAVETDLADARREHGRLTGRLVPEAFEPILRRHGWSKLGWLVARHRHDVHT